MMVWLIFAGLSAATLGLLLQPLLRGMRATGPTRADYDMVIYRNQLAEIAQDVERGLLPQDQADTARAEIHRRMLAAEDAELAAASGDGPKDSRRSRLIAVFGVALAVPLGSVLLYLTLGSPNLLGKPKVQQAAREANAAAASEAERLAPLVQKNPSIRGFTQLADTYFAAHEYDLAAGAYQRAIDLGANDAGTLSQYGEATVLANDGAVVLPALKAFITALDMDAHDARSRFYFGLAEAQIGDFKKAVAIWKDLEQDSAPGSSWLGMLREHISTFANQGGFDPATIRPQPPAIDALKASLAAMSQAQGAPTAAATASPPVSGNTNDDSTMIEAMVARLAARLEANPNDPDGWQRLARSYSVQGKHQMAREAIDHAIALRPLDVGLRLALAEIQKAAAGNPPEPPADYVATMREILKLDPAHAIALTYVGAAEEQAGNLATARTMWERARVGLPADDPLNVELQTRLERLEKESMGP
jgi:cytochrome c-type biogenesis protein CcmH